MGWGGGDIHQPEDPILAWLLSYDDLARSCLGRIRTVVRCCVKPRLISEECLTLKQCGVETYGSRKWYPPPTEKVFFIPGRGYSIFINKLLLRSELFSNIVAILECTKRTESETRNFSQITAPKIRKRTRNHMNPRSFSWVPQANSSLQGKLI